MEIVTPLMKDKILFFLIENCKIEEMSSGKTSDFLNPIGLSFDVFNAVMNQFQRLAIVEDLNLRHSHTSFILLTEAHDFKRKGGFVIQEEIFAANLNKLILEIDALKKQIEPDKLDKLSKISTIAAALVSGLALFKNK